jgi:hypothetical protein
MIELSLRQYTFPIVSSQGLRTRHLIRNLEAAALEDGEVQANTVFLGCRSRLGREPPPADRWSGILPDRGAVR